MNFKTFSILVLFIFLLNSCGLGDNYKQISHQDFLKNHQYNIGQSTLNLFDDKRERPVKTEIWYPTKDTTKINVTDDYPFKLPPTSKDAEIVSGKFPLILLSHGTAGNRISQMWLACELAGNGYVVASVDHFGNTLDNKIPENFVKVWDRPLDISFALKQLLANSKWISKIDSTKVGMAGFSLGGYTAIGLAGGILNYNLLKEFSKTKEGKNEFNLPELGNISELITTNLIEIGNSNFKNLKNDKISAFVAMAPAIGQGFNNENQFKNVHHPVLIIGAQNDERTPIQTNAKHYNNLIKNSEYVELDGKVGHYVFMNVAKNGLERNAPIIFKDNQSVDRKEVHKNIAETILNFFDSKLKQKSH